MLQNGETLGLSVNYIALGEGDLSADFAADEYDIITFLERKIGIKIGGSTTTIGAMAGGEQTAKLIGVPNGAPLIC